jgi:hypothetical protein
MTFHQALEQVKPIYKEDRKAGDLMPFTTERQSPEPAPSINHLNLLTMTAMMSSTKMVIIATVITLFVAILQGNALAFLVR